MLSGLDGAAAHISMVDLRFWPSFRSCPVTLALVVVRITGHRFRMHALDLAIRLPSRSQGAAVL